MATINVGDKIRATNVNGRYDFACIPVVDGFFINENQKVCTTRGGVCEISFRFQLNAAVSSGARLFSGTPNSISGNAGYAAVPIFIATNGNSSVGKAYYLLVKNGTYIVAGEAIPANVILNVYMIYLTNPAYIGT